MRPDRSVEKLNLELYLLGQVLPDEELERIEEAYFNDDGYFERLLEAEDDLIDRYLRGELKGVERSQFETQFLSSARRREKWEVQRAIAEFFRSSPRPVSFLSGLRRLMESQSSWGRAVLVLTTVVVAFGVGLLGWGYLSLRDKAAALQSRLVAAETPPPAASHRLVFSLEPGLVRSGYGNVLSIRSDDDLVRLKLRLDTREVPPGSTFVTALTTVDGEEVWRQGRLASTGGMVEVEIPSSALPRGDYVLSLASVLGSRRIDLPSYVFRVEK